MIGINLEINIEKNIFYLGNTSVKDYERYEHDSKKKEN